MNSTMVPWSGMRIIDGLSNNYTEYLYEYAPRPTCSRNELNGCNSTYVKMIPHFIYWVDLSQTPYVYMKARQP
ncbi:hypothetical protein ANCCAN_26083 [Ancylostoma caninum]|uniref:Uncharacterized protein n=1 Tax=Ancylostoma caninum TaxID=29170 RepID=A0A368FB93_ANCCA|nr:hypothetical protein ANCCAN_26083 [Ancylostoma caninum]